MNPPASAHLVSRAGWSLVWLAVLTAGADAWGSWSSWPGMAVLAPAVVLLGLLGAVATWCVRDPDARAWQYAGLGAGLATVAAIGGSGIASRVTYTTDSAAFNDVATRLLLHGHDPYATTLHAAALLPVPASSYWTYLVGGGHVARVSYPAGAFLLQAPLAALGVHHLTTDWLDLAAWLVTAVLLFRFLPEGVRWLAPLLALASSYALDFANGGTDALFLPFLVVAVWRWDRFVTPRGSRVAAWLSPVALGVACSIKQSPWFCVPFLLVAVAAQARGGGGRALPTAARYGALVLAAFAVVNLPFIVWGPAAWWRGTTLPLTSPLVPDGQGLVTLALHGATGGADLRLLWVAAALVMLGLLVALALWYPTLKRAWVFLVPVVLFIPGRSLSNYLLDFFPVALVAATSVARDGAAPVTLGPRWRAALVGVPLVGALGVGAWALDAAPLRVEVAAVGAGSDGTSISSVTLVVRNAASRALTPHFMVAVEGGHPSGFWHQSVVSGRLPLAPGARATVVITPGRFTWAPPAREYWLVEAYSSSPAAVSTSAPRRWR